ncbi:DNA transfer protein A2 [Providencia phage vB_PreS_PR1]|uniref:DNA transfer protein A2 n=1 Tax=Providencia phage vB_PreS_PR1 TaxID=1931407 RepID=A0A1S6KV27_9CAUD|nr:DNA binding protein [Providencia phage vB_PreS_PR1]AQT25269.1 DNA transfer protein A2 [Providencia phage vB_PreS_PR1]
MSTPSKKRWNEEVTAKAINLYLAAFVNPAEPTDEEIASANAVDNLASIGEQISGDGETYTATAVRTKLSSSKDENGNKIYRALEVKQPVGGGKKLQKITLIRALQRDMSDNDQEKDDWASLEKANLDTIIMIVKKVCPDDVLQGIMEENGIDRL